MNAGGNPDTSSPGPAPRTGTRPRRHPPSPARRPPAWFTRGPDAQAGHLPGRDGVVAVIQHRAHQHLPGQRRTARSRAISATAAASPPPALAPATTMRPGRRPARRRAPRPTTAPHSSLRVRMRRLRGQPVLHRHHGQVEAPRPVHHVRHAEAVRLSPKTIPPPWMWYIAAAGIAARGPADQQRHLGRAWPARPPATVTSNAPPRRSSSSVGGGSAGSGCRMPAIRSGVTDDGSCSLITAKTAASSGSTGVAATGAARRAVRDGGCHGSLLISGNRGRATAAIPSPCGHHGARASPNGGFSPFVEPTESGRVAESRVGFGTKGHAWPFWPLFGRTRTLNAAAYCASMSTVSAGQQRNGPVAGARDTVTDQKVGGSSPSERARSEASSRLGEAFLLTDLLTAVINQPRPHGRRWPRPRRAARRSHGHRPGA